MRFASLPLLLGLFGTAFAEPGTPAEFLGDWVPRTSTCQSQLRFRVEAQRVVLINRSESMSFGNLDFCYSCEGGAKYSGKVVWMMAKFGAEAAPPLMAQFNAGEKLGVAVLEIEKPDLKRQFPLHKIALKRCVK